MSWNNIKERSVVWALTVSGSPYRFYSEVPPGDNLMDGTVLNTELTYIDVKAITSVGGVIASIDDVGGIARQDPVALTLLARDAYLPDGSRMNPFHIFRKVTPSGSPLRCRLISSLRHSLAVVDVIVDSDVSGWTVPGMIHIGQESLWATGTAGAGTEGNPYRFTDCTRSVALTQVQGHISNQDTGELPYVTSELVFWRGRRARIHVAEKFHDGTIGEWKEYWRGIMDTAPELSNDGLSLRIRIAPMTAMFNWTIGTADSTAKSTTVAGWHYLTKGKASTVNARAFWGPGQLYMNPGFNADTGADTCELPSYALLTALFDPSLPTTDPRHGKFFSQHSVDIPGESVVSFTDMLPSPRALTEFPGGSALIAIMDAENGAVLSSSAVTEWYPLSLLDGDEGDEELVAWPARLITVINSQTAWNTTSGPIACWRDPENGAPTQDRWVHMSVLGDSCTSIVARKSLVTEGDAQMVFEYTGDDLCWGGFIIRPAEDLEAHRATSSSPPAGAVVPYVELWCTANPEDNHDRIDIIGSADWWYQPGEPYIGPFRDNIYSGVGNSSQIIRITGAGTDTEVSIKDSFEVFSPDDGALSLGWICEVDLASELPTKVISQMPGDPAFVVEVMSRASNTSAVEFILKIAMSGEGRQTNGSYDVLGIGLNLGQAEIDIESFESMSTPVSLSNQTWEVIRGKAVIEQIKGLLIACSCQIAQVYNGSSWVIKLIDLTAASVLDSVATITDDDTISPTATVSDGRLVRAYEFEVNIPVSGSDEESLKIPFLDAAAKNASNGDQGESLKLYLPGVRIGTSANDQASSLLDIVGDLRSRLGFERVKWVTKLPADHIGTLTLGLGDTVTLTSIYASDLNPTNPVSNRPCRVYGINRDLKTNVLELQLIGYAGIMAGYVPALKVTDVVDVDTIEVASDVYAKDGAVDLSYYNVGDRIACVPIGDYASRVETVITAIDRGANLVTTFDNHGLAVGDTIRFGDYDDVSDTVKGYAYIADNSDVLGADSDPAYIIV